MFLAATKPQLTIQDIQEALRGIDRHEVVQLLDRKIAGLCEELLVFFHKERLQEPQRHSRSIQTNLQ